MRAEEIKDAESLQAWLESLPQKSEDQRETARRWAVTIAHRAAMRVLPVYWKASIGRRARYQNYNTIAVLRCNLLSELLAGNLDRRIVPVALDASRSATKAHRAGSAARATLNSAVVSISDRTVLSYAVRDSVKLASRRERFLWNAINQDITVADFVFEQEKLAADLRSLDLWHVNNSKNRETAAWNSGKSKILAQGEGWRFWVEWYENTLYGRPQDYDLLTKIALIDPADWDKGADHVNALIQRIVEQHNLVKDARALKEEIAQLKERLQSVEHRSHNNPPELVDETVAAQKEVTIIWAALDEAENELEKSAPDLGRLRQIGEFILKAAKAIGAYCASLADDAIRTANKTVVGGAVGLALLAHQERLVSFGSALIQFAKSLGAP
ncbi:hypothetical protein [Roseibaca calidilacus]|uniref:Uncharacterized protein n=1 Tax=Roseibaca calidilacus TaxID=1666912 RepID=A0ABP2BXM5_9RHOB|nr:hypothetical protein [Roseibaca calidilacus]CUX82437.1 hypothetical protein Ga0058931_2374 [Roseibaca calidilacus]